MSTPAASSTLSTEPENDTKENSKGIDIGVGVGVVIGVAAIVAGIGFSLWRRARRRRQGNRIPELPDGDVDDWFPSTGKAGGTTTIPMHEMPVEHPELSGEEVAELPEQGNLLRRRDSGRPEEFAELE